MKELQNIELPFVSIIIPVYNDYDGLFQCLDALKKQDYPNDKIEIIVVDNKSNHIPESIYGYKVIFLKEDRIRSSYAARNKGIVNSKGDVIAFLDSDCVPYTNWMTEGIRCFINENADIIGGKIEFLIKKNSFFHKFDSRFHLQQEFNISNNTAVTANLFLRKTLFEKIGFFPEWVSGGDSFWTHKAVGKGFKLLFAKQSIVIHPSRGFWGLLKKRRRTGIGFVQRLRSEGNSGLFIAKKLFFLGLLYPGKPIPKGFPHLNGFYNYCFSQLMIGISAFSGFCYLFSFRRIK